MNGCKLGLALLFDGDDICAACGHAAEEHPYWERRPKALERLLPDIDPEDLPTEALRLYADRHSVTRIEQREAKHWFVHVPLKKGQTRSGAGDQHYYALRHLVPRSIALTILVYEPSSVTLYASGGSATGGKTKALVNWAFAQILAKALGWE